MFFTLLDHPDFHVKGINLNGSSTESSGPTAGPEWRADITTLILNNLNVQRKGSLWGIMSLNSNGITVLQCFYWLLLWCLFLSLFIFILSIIHIWWSSPYVCSWELGLLHCCCIHTHGKQHAASCSPDYQVWGVENLEKLPVEWWLVMGSECEWADWSMWETILTEESDW